MSLYCTAENLDATVVQKKLQGNVSCSRVQVRNVTSVMSTRLSAHSTCYSLLLRRWVEKGLAGFRKENINGTQMK